jgi:hypothetical protein
MQNPSLFLLLIVASFFQSSLASIPCPLPPLPNEGGNQTINRIYTVLSPIGCELNILDSKVDEILTLSNVQSINETLLDISSKASVLITDVQALTSILELVSSKAEEIEELSVIENIYDNTEIIKSKVFVMNGEVLDIQSKANLIYNDTSTIPSIKSELDQVLIDVNATMTTGNVTQSKIFVMNDEVLDIQSKANLIYNDTSKIPSIKSELDQVLIDVNATMTTGSVTQSKIFVMNDEVLDIQSKANLIYNDTSKIPSIKSELDQVLIDVNATMTTGNTTQSKIFVMNSEILGIDSKVNQLAHESTVDVISSKIDTLLANSQCAATPLYAAQVISTPGYYCLASDVVGTMVINTNNVVLDLNSNIITGSGDACIQINQSQQNIIIRNGMLIGSSTIDGIDFNTNDAVLTGGQSNVLIENIAMISCVRGIDMANAGTARLPIQDVIVNNCQIFGSSTILAGSQGVYMNTTSNAASLISKATITNCYIANYERGIYLNSGTTPITDVYIDNSTTQSLSIGGIVVINSDRVILSNSNVQSVFGTTTEVHGIDFMNGSLNLIDHCNVENVSSTNESGEVAGIEVEGETGSQVRNCMISGVFTTENVAYGIRVETSEVGSQTPVDCVIQDNLVTRVIGTDGGTGTGISWSGTGSVMFIQNAVYNPGFTAYSANLAVSYSSTYSTAGAWQNFYQ